MSIGRERANRGFQKGNALRVMFVEQMASIHNRGPERAPVVIDAVTQPRLILAAFPRAIRGMYNRYRLVFATAYTDQEISTWRNSRTRPSVVVDS
jgi:hypothetical protein